MAQLTRSTFDPKVARWWWRSLRQWLYELIDPLYASFRGENSEDLTLTNVTQINGVTAAEIATLDGITATTAEMNKLGGLTADATDLNKTGRAEADGIAEASKAVVLDANKDIFGKRFDINRSSLSLAGGDAAYQFDGIDDEIEIPLDNPASSWKQSRTIDAFIAIPANIASVTSTQYLFSSMNTSPTQIMGIIINGSNHILSGMTDNSAQWPDFAVTGVTNMDDFAGQWVHIAFVINGTNLSLHVNGKLDATKTIANLSDFQAGDAKSFMARCGWSSAFGMADVSTLRIWNRALTADQIADLASGAAVGYLDSGASQTNLVANNDAFTGATGSTPPTSWSDSGAGTASYIIRNNTGVANMDADVLEFSSSGGEKILKQTILTPGKRYRLSFAYRNYDGSAASYVYMGTSANQAILTHTTMVGDGMLFSQEFLADGTDLGFVAADGGAIQMDDVQVIPIGCVAQYESDGIGSTTWYDKSGNGLHGAVNGATAMNLPMAYVNDVGRHMVEGESGQRCVLRAVKLRIEPGATPGANVNVTDLSSATIGFNGPVLTNATNLAKNGSSGSFSMSGTGKTIVMDLTEDIIGTLSGSINTHDLNSSSMTELYSVNLLISESNLNITMFQRGTQIEVDWTTILGAGDRGDILIAFITSL